MSRYIKKEDLVFDIGGNIGYYALIMAKKVGTKGKVFCFEPDKTNFSILTENICKNKYENIIKERRDIYLKGYGLGLILAFISLFLYEKFGGNDKRKGLNKVCFIGGITLLVNYFYYMLTPKSDWMLNHMGNQEEVKAWLQMYREMQYNYHAGLALGIIAVGILAFAFRC